MEFRLIYQGPLPSAGAGKRRAVDKHAIRQQLHPQLRELWRTHRRLSNYTSNGHAFKDHITLHRFGYRFVPLISEYLGLVCSLDVIFLRRDEPGNLIQGGGDIDNRIKVLFDALRMPQSVEELAGATPSTDQEPFYCLLEDDRLITEVKVTTDRLLTPPMASESQNDVHLVMRVTTIALVTPTL